MFLCLYLENFSFKKSFDNMVADAKERKKKEHKWYALGQHQPGSAGLGQANNQVGGSPAVLSLGVGDGTVLLSEVKPQLTLVSEVQVTFFTLRSRGNTFKYLDQKSPFKQPVFKTAEPDLIVCKQGTVYMHYTSRGNNTCIINTWPCSALAAEHDTVSFTGVISTHLTVRFFEWKHPPDGI